MIATDQQIFASDSLVSGLVTKQKPYALLNHLIHVILQWK
jgi:hypothetical protein